MDYKTIAAPDAVQATMAKLAEHGVEGLVVKDGVAALEKIKELIPAGASVMNGASQTLEQIGFVEYLRSGEHGWNNLHEGILAEKDPAKKAQLRKQAELSDFYLGSVHALSETGEFLIASNTGSQLPHIVFTSPNLIFVVGAQKIVPTLDDAMKRLDEYVVPLENERMQQLHGMNTMVSKIVVFKRENTHMGRKVRMIIVQEALGF